MAWPLVAAAALAAVAPGCAVPMAWRTEDRFHQPPRLAHDVSIVLVPDDAEAAAAVRDAFNADPHVKAAVIDAADRQRIEACTGYQCQAQRLCAFANERGADYYGHVSTTISETGLFVCDRLAFGGAGEPTCAEGHFEEQTIASARLSLEMSATHWRTDRMCRSMRELNESVETKGASAAEARALAYTRMAPALAHVFPSEVTLGPDGRPPPDRLAEGEVYAVFRGERHGELGEGLVSVARAPGSGTARVERITCCFQERPGDTLVFRGPQLLMGLVPAGLLARTSGLGGGGAWAGGFGLYVRAQTIGGGWQVGLGFEHLWAGASTSLWSGVGELGYALRVSPTLTVALLAGGGGGAVARPNPAGGGDIEARGGQAFGLARVSWRGSRFWFFDVDAGWQRSLGYRAWTGVDAGVAVAPFALDGPLLRVGGGIL